MEAKVQIASVRQLNYLHNKENCYERLSMFYEKLTTVQGCKLFNILCYTDS